MTPYRCYWVDGILSLEPAEARVVKKNSRRYTLIDENLFRHGFTHLTLICGSHIGGQALSSKAVRAGYYWPTMREDCTRYAQRCK